MLDPFAEMVLRLVVQVGSPAARPRYRKTAHDQDAGNGARSMPNYLFIGSDTAAGPRVRLASTLAADLSRGPA
jgi:hypothetical protein